jgi:adenine-specific DNA methylase
MKQRFMKIVYYFCNYRSTFYYAIAYADLSDFFYVWFERTLADVYPLNFATPQTPKTEECTALKHHHDGNLQTAKEHFESKLLPFLSECPL